jgi:hypothetical protein
VGVGVGVGVGVDVGPWRAVVDDVWSVRSVWEVRKRGSSRYS